MVVTWEILKDFSLTRASSIQWIDLGFSYHTKCFDSYFVVECDLVKGTGECTDFEENFKNIGNKRLGLITDEDGAQVTNPKFAGSGRSYNSLHFESTLGIAGSMYCKDRNGGDLSYVQAWTKKSDGSTITDPADNALAVETIILLNPEFSYDIQGFCLYQSAQPSSDIRMWGVLAPFAPVEYGGQKEVITGCNLAMAPYGLTFSDYVGDSATSVKYLGAGSNEMMLIFKHGENTSHKIMGELFWYI